MLKYLFCKRRGLNMTRCKKNSEDVMVAFGAALFMGFWVGSALFIILMVVLSAIDSSIVEAIDTFGTEKTLVIMDIAICLVTYFLVRRFDKKIDKELEKKSMN
jgi:hypothetical protein